LLPLYRDEKTEYEHASFLPCQSLDKGAETLDEVLIWSILQLHCASFRERPNFVGSYLYQAQCLPLRFFATKRLSMHDTMNVCPAKQFILMLVDAALDNFRTVNGTSEPLMTRIMSLLGLSHAHCQYILPTCRTAGARQIHGKRA